MKCTFLLTAGALAATALGASHVHVGLETDVPIHDPRTSSWRLAGPPPAEEEMTLTVSLRVHPERRSKLEKVFWAVSDLNSNSYGKYLTKTEIKELLAVPMDRVERVKAHFRSNGAKSVHLSAYNDMLTVKMAVADVERALSTKIGAYTHLERDYVRILRASTTYKVPIEIANDVAMVDLLQFPRLRPKVLEREAVSVEEDAPLRRGDWPNACEF